MTARITSWSQLREHLTASYAPVQELGEQSLEVNVSASTGPHPVTVKLCSAFGFELIELRCSLGPAREVPPTGALLRNTGRIVGPFGVAQGALIVRQLLPFQGLAVAQLDEAMKAIAEPFSPQTA